MQSLADSEPQSSLPATSQPAVSQSVRRAESLRRDSPMEPILLARQALQGTTLGQWAQQSGLQVRLAAHSMSQDLLSPQYTEAAFLSTSACVQCVAAVLHII